MTAIKALIIDKRYTMQQVIDGTGIARNRFFIGMKHPAIFNDAELQKIGKLIGVGIKEIQSVI